MLIENILRWLDRSPWSGALFLVLAVVGIVLTIVLHLRASRKKRLIYTSSSFTLIRPEITRIPDLSITHRGQPVQSLTLTDLTIWNQGRGVVEPDDVASADPIRIVLGDTSQICSVRISGVTNETNDFRIEPSSVPNEWLLEFEYIGRRQGASIRVLHGDPIDLSVKLVGTLKESGKVEFLHSEGMSGRLSDAVWARLDPFLKRFEPSTTRGFRYTAYWTAVALFAALPAFLITIPFSLLDAIRRPVVSPPDIEKTPIYGAA